jgi:hypothetical protein
VSRRLERSTFEGQEGTRFTAIKAGWRGTAEHGIEPVAMTLTSVADRSRGSVDAFACFFHGPADRELPQATYLLTHDVLGEIEAFLVPVLDPGSDGSTVCYELSVSRLKEGEGET